MQERKQPSPQPVEGEAQMGSTLAGRLAAPALLRLAATAFSCLAFSWRSTAWQNEYLQQQQQLQKRRAAAHVPTDLP